MPPQQRRDNNNRAYGSVSNLDHAHDDGDESWFGYERSPLWSPTWANKRSCLKPTGMAEVMKIHGNLAAPITFSPFKNDDDHKNKVANPKKLRSTDHGKRMKDSGNLASPITHIRDHHHKSPRKSKRISSTPPQSPTSVAITGKSLDETTHETTPAAASFKSPKSSRSKLEGGLRRSKSEGKSSNALRQHSPKKDEKERKLLHRSQSHRHHQPSPTSSPSLEWEKPSWIIKHKQLKSTGKADIMKTDGNLAAPITFTPFKNQDHTNHLANPNIVLKSTNLGEEMKASGNLAKPITHIRDYKVKKNHSSSRKSCSSSSSRSSFSSSSISSMESLLTPEEQALLKQQKRLSQENIQKINCAKALVDFLPDTRSGVEKRRSSHGKKKKLRPHFLNLTTIHANQ